jgi:hypothetical protein
MRAGSASSLSTGVSAAGLPAGLGRFAPAASAMGLRFGM